MRNPDFFQNQQINSSSKLIWLCGGEIEVQPQQAAAAPVRATSPCRKTIPLVKNENIMNNNIENIALEEDDPACQKCKYNEQVL